MNIEGSIALVTGANRGLGASFCRELLEQGAAKVYAGARDPDTVDTDGVTPIRLDITDHGEVAAAAEACGDVTLLINNAGITTSTSALADDAMQQFRRELDTNVFGTLAMTRAFVPALQSNGSAAIVNVLSVLSWLSMPGTALYCAAKAASWSLTNSLRQELTPRDIHVLALHVGLMDTDMTAGLDVAKSSPDDVARQTLAGLRAGDFEVLADAASRRVHDALSGDLTSLYPSIT